MFCGEVILSVDRYNQGERKKVGVHWCISHQIHKKTVPLTRISFREGAVGVDIYPSLEIVSLTLEQWVA